MTKVLDRQALALRSPQPLAGLRNRGYTDPTGNDGA